jgi:hypothetical protein
MSARPGAYGLSPRSRLDGRGTAIPYHHAIVVAERAPGIIRTGEFTALAAPTVHVWKKSARATLGHGLTRP